MPALDFAGIGAEARFSTKHKGPGRASGAFVLDWKRELTMPLPDALQAFVDMARTEISGADTLSAGRLMGNVNAHLHNLNELLEPNLETARANEVVLNAVSELQQELAVFPFADKEKTEALRQAALSKLSALELVLAESKLNNKARILGL